MQIRNKAETIFFFVAKDGIHLFLSTQLQLKKIAVYVKILQVETDKTGGNPFKNGTISRT